MAFANRKKYSSIEELTTEILHEFIDGIILHHKENICFGQTKKEQIAS